MKMARKNSGRADVHVNLCNGLPQGLSWKPASDSTRTLLKNLESGLVGSSRVASPDRQAPNWTARIETLRSGQWSICVNPHSQASSCLLQLLWQRQMIDMTLCPLIQLIWWLRGTGWTVYLGEDAFNQLLPVQAYTRTIQGQHRRIVELERASMETMQRLRASEQGRLKAEARTAELQQELENNAEVFKLHYTELLTKDEEIERLKNVIEGLAAGQPSGSHT
ncbi:hypothetical protein WJX74_006584 [Apatococcus lobatus]|uniref:Uncharacterized protein n=1 Tax=Apatococcus lobatus TaxID=904363 RepID=A0AAW1SFZ1_9CHLO